MTLDPNMEKIVDKMQEQCETAGNGMFGDADRKWFDFRDLTKVGKFEFEKIHTLFSRDKSNEEYLKLRKNAQAKMGDLQTAKISAEYLSALERDFRMRHRSRIRNFVHAGIRMYAKGQDAGPLRKQALDWLPPIQKEVAEKGGE